MSLLDKLKKFDDKPNEIKKEKLHPPMVPKKVKNRVSFPKKETQKKSNSINDKSIKEFKIDWIKLAQSSDFKRAVYLALEGKSWRGSNDKLDKVLNKKIEVFRDPNFYGAVKQMKTMFKNGFIKPSDIIKEQAKIENEEIVENGAD